MQTQFTGSGESLTLCDEVNSNTSAVSASRTGSSYYQGFSDVAEATIPLTSVVQALSYGEMAVALYASDAASDLLMQELAVSEIETLACQGLHALELRVLRFAAFHLFEGDEGRVKGLFSDEIRLEAATSQAYSWDHSSRGHSVGRESFGLEGVAA